MKKEYYMKKISEVTGEDEKIINNTLKTIYTRIEGMKDVRQKLEEVGINTDNKTVDDILQELELKWKQLDEDTQIKLSRDIAGMFNIARFMSMMR